MVRAVHRISTLRSNNKSDRISLLQQELQHKNKMATELDKITVTNKPLSFF
jgi:hypothetical protein